MLKRKPRAENLPESRDRPQKFKDEVDRVATRLFGMQLDFFRTGYYSMIKIALGELLIILGLVAVVLILAFRGVPEPDYFSVDPAGRITQLTPVNQPAVDDEKVRQFVVDAIGGSMNLTYLDFDDRMGAVPEFYTDDGFTSFKNAIKASGLEEQIKEKRLLMKTVVLSAPVIESKGSYGGVYAWVVKARVRRTLTDRAREKNTDAVVTFYVQRIPSTERARMIGIYKIKQDLSSAVDG